MTPAPMRSLVLGALSALTLLLSALIPGGAAQVLFALASIAFAVAGLSTLNGGRQ